MEECKAPGGRHRGCCEQIPWQRWMEFTGQPSTPPHRMLRRRTERFWFQMMERPGALSITEQQNYRGWNDSRETQCWLEGTCLRTPKENQALTLNLIWPTDILLHQQRVLAALTLLLLLWEEPLTETIEQLSATLLMWDSGHFSVSSQLGIEEHTEDCKSMTPWCTCR